MQNSVPGFSTLSPQLIVCALLVFPQTSTLLQLQILTLALVSWWPYRLKSLLY